MEDKDIVGKEFEVFKFKDHEKLRWDNHLEKHIGCKAIVKNLHNEYPEYCYAHIIKNDGKTMKCHFPTHLVKQKIEEQENRSIDDLLIDMKQLISRL